MCGLAGGWSRTRFDVLREALPAIGEALHHRGPDDTGEWLDAEAGVALCHRRLAIVDLSPAGHQPMRSHSGRWVIVFNGEIYNHLELRAELGAEGCAPIWRGHSDTETLLAAFDAWGVSETLGRCVGMFALALWDREQRRLWLARDRFGEKPLYYGWHNGIFCFGSELKALRRLIPAGLRVDHSSLALYLRYGAVPAPYSIYEGISKLLPGHWLALDMVNLERGATPTPQPYWLAAEVASHGLAEPFRGSEPEATDRLEALLSRSIAGQMTADVPVGAFLSGGIDSSAVAALMQAQSAQPIQTFSIGFHEESYNEAQHASAVARHLGTCHTELYVTPKETLDLIPRLTHIYDEPFSDASQVPTLLLSQLARSKVTVSLSGDGGDELFCGYRRYFLAARAWQNLSVLPSTLRHVIGRAITGIPIERWDQLYRTVEPVLPRRFQNPFPGEWLHRGGSTIMVDSGQDLYRRLISLWEPDVLINKVYEPSSFGPPRNLKFDNLVDYMMVEDACHYMSDDILVKVDRAAMAFGLETRVPMLDHRLYEFAWSLPQNFKMKGQVSKHILRQVLYRYVPQSLLERPKMGFGVPIGSWLRGPLRDWATELLDPDRLKLEGYFDPGPIRQKWQEHLAGKANWQYPLWNVLMFQSWLEAD
jgi:asparagine synthase (glutamine-hydrolysing)